MKQRKSLRLLSMLLALVMVLELCPTQAHAVQTDSALELVPAMPEVSEPEQNENDSDIFISGEVTELRGEYEKHYRLTDGSFMAVQYQVPVHYQDDGQWVDIDNTLEAVTMFSGDSVYQAVNGENIQAFAADLSSGTIMTLASGEYMLSMSLLPAGTSEPQTEGMYAVADSVTASEIGVTTAQLLTADAETETSVETTEDEPWELEDVLPDGLRSGILYENVFPGTDLRYDTFSYNVKEHIILKQRMDLESYAYTFALTMDGLEPVLQEDGSILLLDESDEIRYTIPAPYMWDAENRYSDAVYYQLEETVDGWILTVCADEDWLEEEDRAYPVTIDPSIEINNDNMRFSSSVEQGTPTSTSAHVRPGQASVGTYTSYGDIEGYIKIQTLPELPAGSIVTEAKLAPGVFARNYITVDFRVDISMLSEALSDSEWNGLVAWNSRPNKESVPMDFVMIDYEEIDYIAPTSWDITPAVMHWYQTPAENFGLALTATLSASNPSSCVRLNSGNVILSVVYRNTVGTESYYTYETQSAVRAGTGYVGDYSSALTVYKNDLNYSSTTTPYSISHVYNSSLGGQELSEFDTDDTFVPDYSHMQTGYGWQLSVQESVRQTTINDTRYLVYRDGDGTLHYFKKSDGNIYVDEDGLGLEISQGTTGSDLSYMMEDQSGNQRYFRNGYLKYIKDTNGNKICFLYNGDTYSDDHTTWHPPAEEAQLTAIAAARNEQEPQTICTFHYNEDNVLYQIKDYANRTTTFTYSSDSGGYLEKITHPDGTTVHYGYDNAGHLTSMYDAEAKYGIEYTYDGDSVSAIQEYAIDEDGNKIIGARVQREKPSIQETVYRYDGSDRQFRSEDSASQDDIVNRYTFDYAGRTINAVTLDADEDRILGVTAAAYRASSSETPAANNRISKTGQSGQNGVNLLKDSGLEAASADWVSMTAGQANYTGEISTTTARTGHKALKTGISSAAAGNSNETLRAGMYQTVTLEANTTYTFSAYVNTSGVTNFPDCCVYAAFLGTDNSILKAGNQITYTTGEEIDNGWQRIYCTYETGSSSLTCRVAVIQENALGTVYYDDLQLEIGDVPSSANLLQNATFDFASNWELNEFEYLSNSVDPLHSNVLAVSGQTTKYLRAVQRVEIEQVCTDQTFLLSGWGKAASAADCRTSFSWSYGTSIDNKHESRYFGLIARAWYEEEDGDEHAEYFFMPFNDDYDGWQFASCVIVPDSYYQQEAMILKHIDVYVTYDRNFNTMYVDNLSLRQEPCTTYTYNALGNIISIGATGSESQAVQYISGDDVRPDTVWKSNSEVYYYQYKSSNKYLPEYISNALNLVYTYYDYDEYGNTVKTEIGQFNEDEVPSDYPKLRSTAVYSSDGSLLTQTTNANGQTTTYSYETNNTRQVRKTKDANGTIVDTLYHFANDRSSMSYITGVISVQNTYSNGLLSRIIRGGYISGNTVKQNQYYNLSYDAFGNMTAVSVGADETDARTLAIYLYGEKNGQLEAMIYGNFNGLQYEYDELGRLVSENWSDGRTFRYFYDSEGALAQKVDVETGDVVNYTYDSIGRLIHSSITENGSTTLMTEHLYDRQNRIGEQSYQLRDSDGGYTTYSMEYDYRASDGLLRAMNCLNGGIVGYSLGYDELARLSSRTNSRFAQTYAYRTSGSTTTTQIESIDYDAGTSGANFSEFTLTYGYDAVGNIDSITGTGISGQNASYEYDVQGQLTSATVDGKNYTYEYDTYGNIREAVENGTTHTYTYGDADWVDLLTAYDGESITYDQIGNPTSYYNGTRWDFEWEHGRQLVSAESDAHEISYTYDMDGIRDSKTVDGVTYHYDTLNGKVVRQTWTQNNVEKVFDIIYDANGQPYACVYESNKYYYVLNQQGDVIRIVNSSGAAVAVYSYDPWGNIISKSGTLADVNPIRYRGYYYDQESGLYYLQSRYYDPSIGRFINADSFASTGQDFLGYNMFAYCLNNPVMGTDPTGEITIATLILIGSAVIGAVCAGYTAYKEYQAGFSTGRIICDSIVAGVCGFNIAYTCGMSAYECYQTYCYLNGLTPVTEVSFSNNTVAVYSPSDAPKQGIPNSQYNKLDSSGDGTIVSTTQYNANGQPDYRIDYYCGTKPHAHFDKQSGMLLYDHVHTWSYNENGYVNGKTVEPL